MTVPRMQKPREQMQDQFFMGVVKKKKTKMNLIITCLTRGRKNTLCE